VAINGYKLGLEPFRKYQGLSGLKLVYVDRYVHIVD
jgi:hypothetical protein